MAYNVTNNYKNVIYSGDARNKLKLLFNNVELQDADRYCERMTVKSRIVPNGAKIFSLNNFISKEAELILHDIDTSIIQDQVSISIGTLVGNSYEYVPIGIFNIQDTPTNDKNKTTIKLRDNSVKFDFNYNAQPLIEQNNGVATKLQILQDICTQTNVTCNITSFLGYLDEIGVYDNTITARQYIANIAEQAGKIATINRNGELIFVDLNNLTTWEIPIEIVEKYENGTKFKIGRVVYEDGIVRYETPTSNDDTLFLDGSNNYINGELVKEQASSGDNSYYLENTGDNDLAYFELEGKTTQETRSGKNLLDFKDGTYSNDYITVVVKNGVLTINGTNSSGSNNFLSIPLKSNYSLNNGSTYTLSINNSSKVGTSSSYGTFRLHYSGGGIIQDVNFSYLNNKNTFTATQDVTRDAFQIRTGIDITYSNFVIKPQLELGSTATDWELYGASPSPDYPSELVSVGYENLLKLDSEFVIERTTQGITKKISEDGGVIVSGTPTQNNSFWFSPTDRDRLLLKAGTYTMSASPSVSLYIYIRKINSNTKQTINVNTFTISEDFYVQNMALGLLQGQEYNETFYIQLTKGSIAHSYIPYGKYGIEIETKNSNLIGLDTKQYKVKLNVGDKITLKNTTSSALTLNLYTNYGDTTRNDYWTIGSGSTRTITIAKKSSSIAWTYNVLNDGIAWVNYGSTILDYEEHKDNTYLYTLDNPLRSIGNYKDLLYIKNGMLYVDRKIGTYTFTGTEGFTNWSSAIVNDTYLFGYNENWELPNYSTDYKTDYFTTNTAVWENDTIGSYVANNAFRMRVPSTIATTVNEFKTWLSNNNVEVQYVLAEPYTETLGQVDMPSTYEGITYIDIESVINTNSYIQYRQSKNQLEAILENTNQFNIDSLKTGKILGNPAIDSYDLIQISDGNKIFKTLATNDLVYTGVLINTFDTQIGEEAKEQNVFINGEDTFKKWARTKIDNVEGSISLQAGQIDETNGRIDETNLTIQKDGALLNVLANNSNIDVAYDSEGNPLSGEVREVTTTTGFKFNADGMSIEDSATNFKALHRNTGTYYYDGDTIVGQYTKDGSKQKDLELFGVYYYGKEDKDDTPMFVAQLYTDKNGEECFGHFYNRGD